jgi:hypothetical protein
MKRGLAILLATTLSTTAWGWEYDSKHHHEMEHHHKMPKFEHHEHHFIKHYPHHEMHHMHYVHHMHMPPPPPKPPVVPPTPPAPTPPTASTSPTSMPPAQKQTQLNYGRHGSTVGVWIAGGMVGCGTLSLMIGAAYVAKTQHRELTTQEANELVFGCILPILGPALVDNYYATHRR